MNPCAPWPFRVFEAQVRALTGAFILDGLAKRPLRRTLCACEWSAMNAAPSEIAELTAQITRLSAQLQLLTAAQSQPRDNESPWLPLSKAAKLLHWAPRTLRRRIVTDNFPENCCRRIVSPSGKRTIYLVNVQRYLKSLH